MIHLRYLDKCFICCLSLLPLNGHLMRVLELILVPCGPAELMFSDCQAEHISFDIVKSGYAWSGQMFVSKSFSLNVKSIALNIVWNAKLNLFIYMCPSATEMDVLRVATFYPHLHCTCRPTQMWVCGQDLSWNTTCNRNIMQIRNYCKCQSINVFADIHDVRHGLPT